MGSALVHRGNPTQGIEMAHLGIENWRKTGALLHVPTWSSFLADAALAAGNIPVAESAVASGLLLASTNNDVFALAELQRLNAMIMASKGEVGEARTLLKAAAGTARQQGAVLYELRSLTELGRLSEGLADHRWIESRLASIHDRTVHSNLLSDVPSDPPLVPLGRAVRVGEHQEVWGASDEETPTARPLNILQPAQTQHPTLPDAPHTSAQPRNGRSARR